MASVELKAIHKAFGAQTVLRGLDLKIEDGEFVVVVGPSGCGKSTLLRVIAGLDRPDAGQVLIDGRDALPLGPAQRGVAMVFQSYALYPHLNAYDNMAFGLRMAGRPEAEIRAEVLKSAGLLGIEALLDRKPRALSGGQRQRVAIGRAIVRQPQLFLLDEPLSNLDAGLRIHMRHEFARLHRELDTTMIYVTHDQVEAMTLASRIVVMSAGGVEQVGTPLEVYNTPRNLFVASFMGSPRMNLIEGEVTGVLKKGVRVRLVSGDEVTAAVEADAARTGDKVTLGIRPEALGREAADNTISAMVDVVETLGSARSVYALADGVAAPLCAWLPADDPARPGQTVALHFRAADVFLFDGDGLAFRRLDLAPKKAA